MEKVAIPQGKNMAFITFKHSVSPPYAKQLFSDTSLHGRRLNISFRTGSIHLPQQQTSAGRQGAPYQRSDSYNRRGGYHSANNSYNQRNGNSSYAGQPSQNQSMGLLNAPVTYPGFAANPFQANHQAVSIQGYRSSADSREYVPQYVSIDNPHNHFRGAVPVNHPDHAVSLDERRQRLLHQQNYVHQTDTQRNKHNSYHSRSRR